METDQDASSLEAHQTFIDETNACLKQIRQTESDRGAVLVAAAFAEELLRRLFKARMRLSGKLTEDLFDGHGPLSTFSALTKIAFCLKWIGPNTFHDLELIRSIRNGFAHSHKLVTFENPSVRSRCRDFKLVKATVPHRIPDARQQFLVAVTLVVLQLDPHQKISSLAETGLDLPIVRMAPSEIRPEE